MMSVNVVRFALAGAMALFVLGGFGSPALTQEATPQGGATTATREEPARPAHIHAGTCEELGEIVYPLNPVTLPQGASVGDLDNAVVAATSYTPLEAPLDQILGAQHAINVHFSDERIEEYIACGEIGGALTEQGALVIALQEQNDSGFAGVAYLSPSAPAPAAASDVSVFLIPLEPGAGDQPTADEDLAATPAVGGGETAPDPATEDAEGTPVISGPVSTPEPSDEEATEEAVVAPEVDDGASFATVDLADPSRVAITAGEELTLVNSGATPRSFVVEELGIDQQVAPGETVSVPLETPGNYRFVVNEGGVEIDDRSLVVE